MPIRRVAIENAPPPLINGLRRLAEELQIPGEFPAGALAEAEHAAATGPLDGLARADLTELAFVTVDPAGSTDLDQAMYLERRGPGFRVWYAIADVAAWVTPGGAIDRAAHERGQTYYAPTWRIPLHPPSIGERAASLLADGRARPALVWCIDLTGDGEVADVSLRRAMIRNRAQLTYAGVQADLDAGRAPETLQLLREIGLLRQRVETARGGVSLNIPEQKVIAEAGTWHLAFRELLPVEGWNAQLSLLTGICAAQCMRAAGIGLLRTLPAASRAGTDKLRRVAASLQLDWPDQQDYPAFVRRLDPADPDALAMLNACTQLFRGAAYTVIGPGLAEQKARHGALATLYAHATAPLRRLVDRHVGSLCVELMAGRAAPEWVMMQLAGLPGVLAESDRRAKRFERGIIDHVEALVLRGHEGQHYDGTIIDLDDRQPERGVAAIRGVAVEAPVIGKGLELGALTRLRLVEADVTRGRVLFESAGSGVG